MRSLEETDALARHPYQNIGIFKMFLEAAASSRPRCLSQTRSFRSARRRSLQKCFVTHACLSYQIYCLKKLLCFIALLALAFWCSPLWWKVFPPDIHIEDFTISKLEQFNLEARILSTRYYRGDRESALSPVDLALGWGAMADPAVIEQIDVSQSDRWYHWATQTFPIPQREIETHSANMHMIPANEEALNQLLRLKKGMLIHLRGNLVHVESPDGWQWTSSLSRSDTGDGACEVVLVESVSIHGAKP